MNCIIDGHNLIPHIPGLSLGMPDDEERLIELLNRYGELQRGKPLIGRAGRPLLGRAGRLEVYFDGAPTGQAGAINYGRVRAHFVPYRTTADEAIRKRLAKLGKSAPSWVVVSSDRSVLASAREVGARVMTAEEFSQVLLTALQAHQAEAITPDQPLSAAEVEEWLAIFKQRKSTK